MTEWLKLIDVTGPFLTEPALENCTPPVLATIETTVRRKLRSAYDEWAEAKGTGASDIADVHEAWIEIVLTDLLRYRSEELRSGDALPKNAIVSLAEHGVSIAPSHVLVNKSQDDEILLMIDALSVDAEMDARQQFGSWVATPLERMVMLLRSSGCPVGLVINGEAWTLVHVVEDEPVSKATWDASFWFQEPETLRAFAGLLQVGRFYGAPDGKLPALFEKSKAHQSDVTETLGQKTNQSFLAVI